MIISHQYKFIFIKTKKTAGTSIEVFLSQSCEENDIVTPIVPRIFPHRERNHKGLWNPLPEILENKKYQKRFASTIGDLLNQRKFYNHIPAWVLRQRVPKNIYDNYFKFCVERNPWDKTLSHYHRVKDRRGKDFSIEKYFQEKNFSINYPLYTDRKGGLIVDKVLKYETLIEDLLQVFGMLGIPFLGDLGVRAKSEHRTDRRHYKSIFTNEQRLLIEKNFANEIQMHGYVY